MAIARKSGQAVPLVLQRLPAASANLKSRALGFLRLMVSGMIASKEYRHLNALDDQLLNRLGLTREAVDQEIRRRHLVRLEESETHRP